MKKMGILLFTSLMLFACTTSGTNDTEETTDEATQVEASKLEELQKSEEINEELEQLDGELDSLLSTIE